MTYRETPPAYQEYASDMLANRNFRSMSLAERGLLNTLRLECWVGGAMPESPSRLALLLGFSTEEIQCAFTPAVMSFFAKEGDELFSPDLEAYRVALHSRKVRMSEGGRAGGRKSQSQKVDQATLQGPVKGRLKASERKREEGNGEGRSNQGASLSKEEKEWVRDFEGVPDS